ncbi:MAG: hypothetical protein QOE45_1178 [Frankiaceae bacterium]|nr:hypothetical protein [Frankiaceae bacterium]
MTTLAREMWTLYEPVHAVAYFAPESLAAFEAAGLRGFWRGYFAGRAAPLGAVGPLPVIAAFHGFAPAMVERAFPDVWTRASPEAVWEARVTGTVAALERLLAGLDVEEAAELLSRAAAAVDVAGRVLGAAHAAMPLPPDPLGRLWHAASVLRECRGDGHVAALVAADVDGCEALVLRTGDDIAREDLQPYRGWTDDEWAAATLRLRARGWLDASGVVTEAGRAARAAVEAATDAAAAGPWRVLSGTQVARLRTVLEPLTEACYAALPARTPIGLPPR